MKIITIIGLVFLAGFLADTGHLGLAFSSGISAFLLSLYFIVFE
jgi:hypothetical protein